MKNKTGKTIPISAARSIASDYGYTQVVIHAYDGATNIQHVTTYGKSEADCVNAAAGGNAIKKMLKWDESLCNAKPRRQIKRERIEKMEEVLIGIAQIIKAPNPDDTLNLAKFVGWATIAENILNSEPNAQASVATGSE